MCEIAECTKKKTKKKNSSTTACVRRSHVEPQSHLFHVHTRKNVGLTIQLWATGPFVMSQRGTAGFFFFLGTYFQLPVVLSRALKTGGAGNNGTFKMLPALQIAAGAVQ